MAGSNDFQTFASAGGANVISQTAYLALAAKATGFNSGIAASAQLNKVWRQSSLISSMIGQFIADQSGQNAVDDGTTATLEANFTLAIQAITQIKLFSNLNLYVNPSTGNDANAGTTPTTAFRTIQRAFDIGYANYNYNRNQLTVNLAGGTYTTGLSIIGMPVGCTQVNLLGNTATPTAVQITVINANAILINSGTNFNLQGVTVGASGTASGVLGLGYGVICSQGWISISNSNMGTCGTAQITATNNGIVTIGPATLFSGNSQYGLLSQAGSLIWANGGALNYSSPVYSIANVAVSSGGNLLTVGASITGSATGPRYLSDYNGNIVTGGGGANFFPGSSVGSAARGGNYT